MECASLDDVAGDGHSVLFEGEPRTVLLSLSAGERVPEHAHPDRDVVVHALAGELELDLDGETHELEPGEVVRFDGDRQISPHAVTDARTLVILAES